MDLNNADVALRELLRVFFTKALALPELFPDLSLVLR